MKSEDRIVAALLGLQADVFRIAFDPLRYGLTFKRVQLATGIPASTLRTYTDGKAEMPLSAFYKLVGVVPDELLSMLLPDGRVIVRAPETIDHDEMADLFRDYLAEKDHSHHPESEAGREIGPNENERLCVKLAVVGGRG